MKFALIGAAAVAAAAFATPALAQAVIEDPGYCAQFYPTQIVKIWDRAIRTPMAVTINGGTGNAMELASCDAIAETEPYRYHGGPKSND
jgi:hypothetical protein